jgi:hypothetical protein
MIAATAFILLSSLSGQGFVHEPFDHYALERHHGFKVYVSYAARKSNDTTQPALDLLSRQLKQVTEIVPRDSLKTLRMIPIFVENGNPSFPCACYHPSPDWLKQNGFIPEKHRSVEISNTKNYVEWVHLNQPFMTLHELAHGYHDILFTHNDKYIGATYKNAKASGKYDLVQHNLGRKEKAYAMNNQMEYFAELSEAYFGLNDFYPFKREELKTFDPEGYAMIERCWGVEPKR